MSDEKKPLKGPKQPTGGKKAPTGGRMVPGRNPHTGKPQGMVRVSEPGSNGGVHRGPDKFPRRNAVRAQYLGALTGQGGGWPVLDAQGRVKIGEDGKAVLVEASPTEMLNSNALAYKIISARAARGLDLDTFLRMQRDAHEALQPTKDEVEKDGEQRPIRPVFELAPRSDGGLTKPREQPETSAGQAVGGAPAPAPLEVDGQRYE